jgi:hypothetical protein
MEPNGTEDEINHSNIKWTMLDSIYGVKRAEPSEMKWNRMEPSGKGLIRFME